MSHEQLQSDRLFFPPERPQVTSELSNNVILTTLNDLYNWARLSSVWPLMYGTACCFIEFAGLIGSRFDFDRFGLVPRATPRQADLIITAGTITMKFAPALVTLYQQMPEPKYVIAMGACTITGGMFSTDSPTTVRGVDKLVPVDVYIPGCPPRPEAIFDAIVKLRKKMATEDFRERYETISQTHRYYTAQHRMKAVADPLTSEYVRMESRQAAPPALAAAIEMGIPFDLQRTPQLEEQIRDGEQRDASA
ncbi:NADH-quinone oxidoreductase subunit NuoB [Gloeobacter morelensis]|uniref:NAD(P)H-quinone oxidoreductase subunit K n=1 Tax=Gloeobacter morelensis MG652769 TaxID=2781736 RepID=A0ABY3PHG8_9CYAN|nr:NADH-quinone oxidoreductase subunit NuoB [Gloeobacter morelensis]UFP93079.1 NADH-quinone oxidoreductase subunit NuoB [Gloeobacter morelensis MG652769]